MFAAPLATVQATVIPQYGGTYSSWPTSWTSLTSAHDAESDIASNPQIDFVGDAVDPVLQTARDSNYVYFRIRVAVDDVVAGTFHDSVILYIDRVGWGGTIDFGLGWDSKSVDSTKHGLEFMKVGSTPVLWKDVLMDDWDGASGSKITTGATPDIGYNDGDGFVRTTGGVNTTNLGVTSYIDFAVSWDYLLNNGSALAADQTWNVQLGSLADRTDHNVLSHDIMGDTVTLNSSVTTGWVSANPVPEPASLPLWIACGSLGFVLFCRRRR